MRRPNRPRRPSGNTARLSPRRASRRFPSCKPTPSRCRQTVRRAEPPPQRQSSASRFRRVLISDTAEWPSASPCQCRIRSDSTFPYCPQPLHRPAWQPSPTIATPARSRASSRLCRCSTTRQRHSAMLRRPPVLFAALRWAALREPFPRQGPRIS